MNLVLLVVFLGLMYYLSQNKQFMKRISSIQPVTIMLLIGVFILVCRLMKWENFSIDDDQWCGDTTDTDNVTHLRKKEDDECPSGLWDRLFASSADQALGVEIIKKCNDTVGDGSEIKFDSSRCTTADGTTIEIGAKVCIDDPCSHSDCCT